MLNFVNETYFAEFGTDRAIRETYFQDWELKGIMVEVGAATPQFLSMSEHFRLNGWRCLCVEPNPKYVEMHRNLGHEIAACACGSEDKDHQDFEIVHQPGDYAKNQINDHSFSALKVKDAYIAKHPEFHNHHVQQIKVNVRKLDSILGTYGIDRLSFLSVDVEGWELEVMRGFSIQKFKPRVILLENYLHASDYVDYMRNEGYTLRQKIHYNYIFTA